MKHSLINSNHIRSNGLDFLDNPMCNHEVYVEIEFLNVPLKSKGTKFMLIYRVPTCA